ncbi:MAG: hypothetical protein ACFB0B_03700 [Thermonemataceae bacterium]
MNRYTKISVLLALFTTVIGYSDLKSQQKEQQYANDVTSVENIVTAVLASISGEKGVERDWTRFRNLFLPTAQLNAVSYKNNSTSVKVYTVNEFIEAAGTWYEDNGFKEYAYKNQIDTFGNIANVFQSYGIKLADGIEVRRGINSFQLVYMQNRWWITNLIWDNETEKNKIPKQYLE